MMTTKGFTLVETLVAITILALAIAGPFQAIQGALRNSFAARDQLVAASLAQEGVEYIRSVRDSNYLSGSSSGLSGLSACQSGPCVIDPTNGTISGTVEPLRLSSGGLYNQQGVSSTNKLTRFTRTARLTTVSPNEVTVTVVVTWQSAGGTFTTTITENLRDWLSPLSP